MKIIICLMLLAANVLYADAQYRKSSSNPDVLLVREPRTTQRVEFVTPQIDGLTGYSADLHTHTFYSDADCSARFRVKEAWRDGIDVLAITDHIEARRYEDDLLQFLCGYFPGGKAPKAENIAVSLFPPTSDHLKIDLNQPIREAMSIAGVYDITIIPGAEITRHPKLGHYNALFTTDNNKIYDHNPRRAIENACAQGALVMHNHPGWVRTSLDFNPFDKEVYEAGLITGVELMNGAEFYPRAVRRAIDYKLFTCSSTDVHAATCEKYALNGLHRNRTIIYAKDKSLASLREAFEQRRMLAFASGTLAGPEELLRKFVQSSFIISQRHKAASGSCFVVLRNTSSVDYTFHIEGGNLLHLKGLSEMTLRLNPNGPTKLILDSTWYDQDKHVEIDLQPYVK